MGQTKHTVSLSESERKLLTDVVSKGKSSARSILRANILLASDTNRKEYLTVSQIASAFNTTATTVETVRVAYCTTGIENCLSRKKRETPPVPAKVTGDVEARIIALACSNPPKGYSKWSVRMIAKKCVELKYIDSVSHMTVSRVLKKTNLSHI